EGRLEIAGSELTFSKPNRDRMDSVLFGGILGLLLRRFVTVVSVPVSEIKGAKISDDDPKAIEVETAKGKLVFRVADRPAWVRALSAPTEQVAATSFRKLQGELDAKTIVVGVLVAAIMGASYPYMVLKLGFGPNVSVVAAFFGFLFLRLFDLAGG